MIKLIDNRLNLLVRTIISDFRRLRKGSYPQEPVIRWPTVLRNAIAFVEEAVRGGLDWLLSGLWVNKKPDKRSRASIVGCDCR